MLKKLIKHEWRALQKPFLIFFIVLAVTTALSCITLLFINPAFDEVVMGFSAILSFCMFMLYYLGLIVCSIGTNVMIAVRFYKSCYTDEGYLTHTLPVSSKQLIGSKTITYSLFTLIMGALMIVSVLIIVLVGVAHFSSIADTSIAELFADFPTMSEIDAGFRNETGIGLVPLILFILVYSIGAYIANIVIIMGCVSLGQLMTKHRILGALLAYFVFYMVIQTISTIAAFPMTGNMIAAEAAGATMTMWDLMGPFFYLVGGIYLVIAVAMYFVNLHMTTKKLNLE